MENRDVLFFDPGGSGRDIAAALCEHGWTPRDVATPTTGHRAPGKLASRVAIAVCTERNHLRQVSESRWIRAVELVALLRGDLLESADVRADVLATCYDFHTLPADIGRLKLSLGHAWGIAGLVDGRWNDASDSSPCRFLLVGESPPMQELRRVMGRMVNAPASLLVTGESGTGKEHVALALHRASTRASGPFVAVNCAALPTGLIQSELFGHEKGSFTGAHQRQFGRVEVANGGTLLLDEIGDLSLEAQVSLLRFLESGTIERVGSTETIPVDVRVIAATHVDLTRAVRKGTFREDLYYRLDVLRLRIPPLRERGNDAELLARHFLKCSGDEFRSKASGFAASALAAMREHDWPGNVRELSNRVRAAMVHCQGRLITRRDLGLERRGPTRAMVTLSTARERAERQAILTSRDLCGGNVSAMARKLGISRPYLYELMKKLGLGDV